MNITKKNRDYVYEVLLTLGAFRYKQNKKKIYKYRFITPKEFPFVKGIPESTFIFVQTTENFPNEKKFKQTVNKLLPHIAVIKGQSITFKKTYRQIMDSVSGFVHKYYGPLPQKVGPEYKIPFTMLDIGFNYYQRTVRKYKLPTWDKISSEQKDEILSILETAKDLPITDRREYQLIFQKRSKKPIEFEKVGKSFDYKEKEIWKVNVKTPDSVNFLERIGVFRPITLEPSRVVKEVFSDNKRVPTFLYKDLATYFYTLLKEQKVPKIKDLDDTPTRKGLEKKWDVLQRIREIYLATSSLSELYIPNELLHINGRTHILTKGILDGLQSNNLFREWEKKNGYYIIKGINPNRFQKEYGNIKRLYKSFATAYQARKELESKKGLLQEDNKNSYDYIVDYNEMSCEIIMNGKYLLARMNLNSSPERIFNYIFNNSGKRITKDMIEDNIKEKVTRHFSKILSDLGFKKEIKKLFFPSISRDTVQFINPVDREKFVKLRIDRDSLVKQLNSLEKI